MDTPPNPNWSPARVEHLRRRWREDGASAGLIGRELGFSRNAVIAKVCRQGWQRRAAAGPREKLQRRPAKPRPARADRTRNARTAAVGAPAIAPGLAAADDLCMARDLPADADPIAFIDRGAAHCAWPIDSLEVPGHARMPCCGAPALPGKPYCPGHAARARRETPPLKPIEDALVRRFAP